MERGWWLTQSVTVGLRDGVGHQEHPGDVTVGLGDGAGL